MKRLFPVGATDQTIDVFIQDSSSAVGAGLTGLIFNSAGLTCYYRLGATGAATQLSLASQSSGAAHIDGGFAEISAGNVPGLYRLDLPDTIFAAERSVTIMLKGATNMAPVVAEIEVTALRNAAATLVTGTSTATGSGTATVVTDITGHGDDTFIGRLLAFQTGSLQYEVGVITDYASSTGTFSFAANTFTGTCGTDRVVIL